ncbi:hypothetical protein [Fictibacillus terranigra]|uniref:Uncharacterized protein n=1 Tax=Fictibacillus terranigra TaxID=3058424 RepID=A0ABT8E1L3_9BACL|nr:hypothetical protein [Fictibacillus sp. CENA-BCM004]MDN4071810.1 hypothetical protein [Fictibacillus sp. CENA-BCM004]
MGIESKTGARHLGSLAITKVNGMLVREVINSSWGPSECGIMETSARF